jgi:putative spermidine/putrescine transport system permease protein
LGGELDLAVASALSQSARSTRRGALWSGRSRLWLLVAPMTLFFIVFFVFPVVALLSDAFDMPSPGAIAPRGDFVLANFHRFFAVAQYYNSALLTVEISVVSSITAAILGYPLAYVIAKIERPMWSTALMILVLASMQLDGVIRLYGMMVLLGDNGLINGTLIRWHYLEKPLPLMYNAFGVIIGTVQITLPFMVLSLIGVIRGIHPSFEEAARSLGASRWRTFREVTLPLTMPGLLAGMLLVFALASSSYVVAALMGGWKVWVLPMHIFQQISNGGHWQFGACIATILFVVNIAAVFIYQAAASRAAGRPA